MKDIETDCLVISWDISPTDIPALVISRRISNNIEVLNTYYGKEAINIIQIIKDIAELKEIEK